MPFTPETKNPGDLIRSADWNAALTAIAQLFAKLDQAGGHSHTGAFEDGPQIGANGLADNAVTANKVAANAVTAAKIASAAVTADKIANAAVTAAKLAAGVIPQIGIAVTNGLQNGQSIPVPSGFAREECIFMVALKWINLSGAGDPVVNCSVNAQGLVSAAPSDRVVAVGVAFGKKGGW